MIGELVNEVFERIGHEWKIGNSYAVPTEDDVEKVLDMAASKLYDAAEGTRLEVGGLIIEKRPSGFDVFIYTGNYK